MYETEKLLMEFFTVDGSFSKWKDVAGIAGNIFAFGLFVSPMPTFRRIMRNKSTEQFSGLPYIYALLNCLICLWYGSPYVSQRNFMLVTVNGVGATFQLCYIILFILHTDKKTKNLVIQTKSVEFMPFYLSLSTFLMSASFFMFGIFNSDAFVYTPNGIGTVLGIVQLSLYCYYHRNSIEEETKEPLIVSYV
ncbi:hypothetical protein DY000_02043040 [Brassica cretica]|uniref:Bidirectional sugar transporter SWEET n=1 Tax=Brassica cretica TaxID=69181 RepID=A0ABQ7B753_BRACR|nr:hypothetical protein DY000_02043040 [Brassica cretica]